jgi:hypothetical protein
LLGPVLLDPVLLDWTQRSCVPTNKSFVLSNNTIICPFQQYNHLSIPTIQSFVHSNKTIICFVQQYNDSFRPTIQSFVLIPDSIVCRDARSLRPVQSSISIRMEIGLLGPVLLDPVLLDWTQRSCVPTNKSFVLSNNTVICFVQQYSHLSIPTKNNPHSSIIPAPMVSNVPGSMRIRLPVPRLSR